MAVEIASAYVQLIPSARGFKAAVTKELGGELRKAGEKAGDDTRDGFAKRFSAGLGSVAKKAAIGFVAAFTGAAVLGKQAVDAASDLEEAQSKVNTVFGDGADIITNWAKQTATSIGTSRKEALDAAGGFGNLFTQLGIGAKDAADMSIQMVNLAADFASFHNADVTQVLEAQSAAFRGEYDAVQRFVPTINAAAVEQKALEMGLAKTSKELTAQDKALATQALLMEGAGAAVGDFARTSDGLANSQRIMSARIADAKAAIGTALMPIMAKLVGFVANAIPYIQTFARIFSFGFTGKKPVENLNGFSGVIGRMGIAARKAVDFLKGLIDRVKLFGRLFVWAFRDPDVTSDGIEGFFERLGVAARQVVDWFKRNWPTIREVAGNVLEAVGKALSWVGTEILPRVVDGFKAVVEWVRDNWPSIRKTAVDVFNRIAQAWEQYGQPTLKAIIDGVRGVVEWVRDNWPQIRQTAVDVFNGIVRAWEQYGQPVVEAIIDAVSHVVDWITEHWGQITSIVSGIFEQVHEIISTTLEVVIGVIEGVIDAIQLIWRNFGDEIATIIERIWDTVAGIFETAWEVISGIVEGAIEVIHGIIVTVMSIIRGDWENAWDGIKSILKGIWDAIEGIVDGAIEAVKTIIGTGVNVIKTVWEGIVGVFNFFRDQVYSPLIDKVGGLVDWIGDRIGDGVDNVKKVWAGIRWVYDWFINNIWTPLRDKVTSLKDWVVDAFTKAKDGVKAAWDLLRDVVKSPINAVIGFYNKGIRWVWNNVISKIPGVGDLPEVQKLNRGGMVPGSGNRDTVPALLTPGEFVITKKAAQAWGPRVLNALNDPRGTIDPAVFGYAAGGYVRSAEEALAWAKKQAGKPYRFPLVGPDAYDCSGFTSALINYILGKHPHSRRHSSGTVQNDPALARGIGEHGTNGLLIGARPPYMTNSSGHRVGHVAATLFGTNMEATPPRVLVGGGARGAQHGMFTGIYHLPGFGGLSQRDKGIVALVRSLLGMKMSIGDPPMGDLAAKAVNRLPRMVYDFLIKKLPSLIVETIKDTAKSAGDFWTRRNTDPWRRVLEDNGIAIPEGFRNGGLVRRNGPILVGENGPEIRWGSRGQFIESNSELRRREIAAQTQRPIEIHVFGAEERYVRDLVQTIRRLERAG